MLLVKLPCVCHVNAMYACNCGLCVYLIVDEHPCDFLVDCVILFVQPIELIRLCGTPSLHMTSSSPVWPPDVVCVVVALWGLELACVASV